MRSFGNVGDCDDEYLKGSGVHVSGLRPESIYVFIVAVLYASTKCKLVPTARSPGVLAQNDCRQVYELSRWVWVGFPKEVMSAESEEPVEGVRV